VEVESGNKPKGGMVKGNCGGKKKIKSPWSQPKIRGERKRTQIEQRAWGVHQEVTPGGVNRHPYKNWGPLESVGGMPNLSAKRAMGRVGGGTKESLLLSGRGI